MIGTDLFHSQCWKSRYACDACRWADCMMDELTQKDKEKRILIFEGNKVIYNEKNIYNKGR